MIKLSKSFYTFEEVMETLTNSRYVDEVIGDFGDPEYSIAQDFFSTKDFIIAILEYTRDRIPGYFNVSYPNCINLNISPFGFSYMKDGVGLGITTRIDRKTKDISYILTFSFNKDKNFLKINDAYNYAIANGFDIKEINKERRNNDK